MQQSFTEPTATLYIVSTPIGNLKDMTYRAVEILNEVTMIFAEDTRTSRILLDHYQIKTPMTSYHDHNKTIKKHAILEYLKQNQSCALISDAGTPLISDPGTELVELVIEEGYHVVAIPGASAILAALVSSNIKTQPFTFIGFLPRKKGDMSAILKTYEEREETLIIYESPKRIQETINLIFDVLGDRKVALARELTKKFETITRGSLEGISKETLEQRGEYVIVVDGGMKKEIELSISDHIAYYEHQGYSEKEAIKMVAKDKGVTKNTIYKIYKT